MSAAARIVYDGMRAAPVRVSALDPDAVKVVTLDIEDWLRGEALSQQRWHPPAGIVIGDGAAQKTIGTGEVLTPAAPQFFVDPDEGRLVVAASVWVDDANPPTLLRDVEIVVSLSTSTRGDDRTVIMRVRDR